MLQTILKYFTVALLFTNFYSTSAQKIEFISEPEIFLPGIVSCENSEVKITFSADGKLMLWGSVDKEGNLSILKSEINKESWTTPEPVSFSSDSNDFDPSFSADGRTVYFFSNRSGGFGGDDLYSVEYDSARMSFGTPVNMGNSINTAGDEWGPAESPNGEKFIFCTDGLKGKGMHDIYTCEKTSDGWSIPSSVSAINHEDDDFDPVILHDNKTILFTRRLNENEAYLYISSLSAEGYSIPKKLNNKINIKDTWNFGSCINAADKYSVYYSTHIKNNSQGRLDIYKIKYDLMQTK